MDGADSAGGRFDVHVLGTFRFFAPDGTLSVLARGAQHLFALLALSDHVLSRASVAEALWPASSPEHARSSLRSDLTRLPQTTRQAVVVTPTDLGLAENVAVDIRQSRALAHRLLDPTVSFSDADLGADSVSALSVDVLTDWFDDWVLFEAERWHQLRVHALEALAQRLIVQGQYDEAAGAALAAVKAEPLRESARAAMIRVHLATGNSSEALGEFQRYQTLLVTELGLEPTSHLRELVAELPTPAHPGLATACSVKSCPASGPDS